MSDDAKKLPDPTHYVDLPPFGWSEALALIAASLCVYGLFRAVLG